MPPPTLDKIQSDEEQSCWNQYIIVEQKPIMHGWMTKDTYLNQAIKSGSLRLISITTGSYYVQYWNSKWRVLYQKNLNSVPTVYSMLDSKKKTVYSMFTNKKWVTVYRINNQGQQGPGHVCMLYITEISQGGPQTSYKPLIGSFD